MSASRCTQCFESVAGPITQRSDTDRWLQCSQDQFARRLKTDGSTLCLSQAVPRDWRDDTELCPENRQHRSTCEHPSISLIASQAPLFVVNPRRVRAVPPPLRSSLPAQEDSLIRPHTSDGFPRVWVPSDNTLWINLPPVFRRSTLPPLLCGGEFRLIEKLMSPCGQW